MEADEKAWTGLPEELCHWKKLTQPSGPVQSRVLSVYFWQLL